MRSGPSRYWQGWRLLMVQRKAEAAGKEGHDQHIGNLITNTVETRSEALSS